MRRFLALIWFTMKNEGLHWLLLTYVVLSAFFATVPVFAPPRPTRENPPPLTKWQAIEYLSAVFTTQLLFTLITVGGYIAVTREAERELLLSCPVSMQEFVMTQALRNVLLTFPGAIVVPILAYYSNGGNVAKSLLLVIIGLASSYLLLVLNQLVKVIAVRRPYRTVLRVLASAYAVAAAVHSLVERKVSPLLSLPFEFMARPIVFCFTISEAPLLVALESAPILALASALTPLLMLASRQLHPEHVKLAVEARFEASESGAMRPVYGAPRQAIYRVLLLHPLLTKGHAATAALSLTLLPALGYALRALFPAQDPGSVTAFSLMGFYLLLPSTITLQRVVVMSDLAPVWVYRVNVADMKAVASAVTLRLAIHGFEESLAFSLFLVAYAGKLAYLLLPVAALPAVIAFAVSAVIFAALVMPKKRLVKRTQAGLTVLDELLSLLLLASSAIFIIPVAFFAALLERVPWWLGYYLLAAVALAAVIHVVGVEAASELLRSRDVAH